MKSILKRFKKQTFFFEILEDWVVFSLETSQESKLEKILTEKDDKVGIELYKITGIKPAEKEATGEVFKGLEALEKQYFNQLNAVSQKSGISKTDIVSILNGTSDISALIEAELDRFVLSNISDDKESEESIKSNLNVLETKQKLKQSKKESKEEIRENAKALEIYLPELNEVYRQVLELRNDYYLSLLMVFFNGDRLVLNKQNPENEPNFTLEDVKALHPDFVASLFSEFLNKEMNGWEKPEEKKEAIEETEEEKKLEMSKT